VESLGFSESPDYSRGETKVIAAATKGIFHDNFVPFTAFLGPGSIGASV